MATTLKEKKYQVFEFLVEPDENPSSFDLEKWINETCNYYNLKLITCTGNLYIFEKLTDQEGVENE